jgi:hypothetical protein
VLADVQEEFSVRTSNLAVMTFLHGSNGLVSNESKKRTLVHSLILYLQQTTSFVLTELFPACGLEAFCFEIHVVITYPS